MDWNGLLGVLWFFAWFGLIWLVGFFKVGKMEDMGLWGRNMD